jgi:hypothetical protein
MEEEIITEASWGSLHHSISTMREKKSKTEVRIQFPKTKLEEARQRLNSIPLLSMEELYLSFGRKRKVVAKDLYSLTTRIAEVFGKGEYSHRTISVNSEFWQNGRDRFWLARMIGIASNYGFITAIDGKYRFKTASTKKTDSDSFYSKSYICNYEYIKQYNSFASPLAAPDSGMEDNTRYNNIYSSPITVVSTFVTNYNTATCKGEKKPITDLKIGKVRIALDRCTLSDLECALYETYGIKHFFDKMVIELNESLPLLEKIRYRFNFESTKLNHTKTKIRGTCSMTNYRKKRNEKPAPEVDMQDERSREEYLDDRLGEGWEEYDVKSSISQVNYLLNNGVWMGNDVDFYKLYSKLATKGPEQRDVVKEYFMRAYFSPSAAKMAADIIKITNGGSRPLTNVERGHITDYCKTLYPKIREVLGKTYDSEIFFHETNVYLLVRDELRIRGIDVVQVYDAFYFKAGTMPKDIDVIFREAALRYYRMLNANKPTVEDRIQYSLKIPGSLSSDDIQNLISRDMDREDLVKMYGEATVAEYEQKDIDDYDEEFGDKVAL